MSLLNPNPSSLLRPHRLPHSFLPKSTKPHHAVKSLSPTNKSIFSVRSSYTSYSFNEWGERTGPEPEPESKADEKLWELKRALLDTVYGSDLGFRASAEVRAEVHELVSQLEAANPTLAPTESTGLLDGNWVLKAITKAAAAQIANDFKELLEYTAFSELLPLLAAGTIPSVKVKKISQSIDTSNLIIENSTTLSTPFSSFSFSASASFEVRSPSRIQVQFKEGKFKPPEIKSSVDLPASVNIFGQNLNLSPVQQSLSPLQNAVEGLARTISGQPPLKIPIPGERTKSWLLITYLDKDFRISRGDGGLFVLVKEGSPLLDY
ncbi:plastid-lipid associated protein PAP / fibrillinfamily protein [Striga asiatica]|uniref:Plastid-lipid associated protein PAP / fibrillinfamily protein n=1 Tax=Striga asiatica TaxID=4170 RepID=A0A5A7PP08_STRAF|nr:plastid-lipid associated protein PAP / fibrillinfamily protein [Striga asiatica]